MTREDIICMAREKFACHHSQLPVAASRIEAFFQAAYAAGAAAERDRMCEQFNIPKELAHEKAKSNEAD